MPLSIGKLTFSTEWAYRNKIYFNATVQDDPIQEEAGYWKGNAHITYSTSGSSWKLNAFVNNLTNYKEPYLTQINAPAVPVNGYRTVPFSFNLPQTYGLQVPAQFFNERGIFCRCECAARRNRGVLARSRDSAKVQI